MANLLTGYAETGLTTAFFVRRRRSDGAWWNVSGTPAFEAYASGHIANYGIAATETGVTGEYTATDPADSTEGDFLLVAAAGSSLAVSDLVPGRRWQDHAGVYAGPATVTVGAISAGAITDAAFTVPAETAGRPSTILAMMRRGWEWLANLRVRDRTSDTVTLYGADNTTVLETQTQSSSGTVDSQSKGA